MVTASVALPATIGPYHVEALLGQGGMGSVYRAVDPTLQRPVAIKLLSPAAAMPGYADRFLQEARILAQLRHPNIVQVYDFGTHEGTPYMVQELLPGPTLEQRLREYASTGQLLAPDEVGAIISQLAAALDAAHALGVIHRDVKPANAIWNAAGQLVLTDFGIAKQTLSDVNQTQAGLVMGTPAYLSPEQAQGLPLTPASDVYALGVVLYELLAGDVPFPGDTPLRVALDHVQTPPPHLATVRPDLPPAVGAVVQQALAKDLEARFRSAGALAHALTQAWAVSAAPPVDSIHAQPTQVWQASPAAPATASPSPASTASSLLSSAPTATPAPMTGATISQGAVPAVPASPAAQSQAPASRRMLPILGGVLAVLFVLGALLALAGGLGRDAVSAPLEVTVAPAATAPAENAGPVAATAAPTLAPTGEPVPPTAPTVEAAPAEAPVDSQPVNGGNGNGNGGNGNGNGGNGNGGNGKDKKDK